MKYTHKSHWGSLDQLIFWILMVNFHKKKKTTFDIEHYTENRNQTCDIASTQTHEPFFFSSQQHMILKSMTLTAECLVLPR